MSRSRGRYCKIWDPRRSVRLTCSWWLCCGPCLSEAGALVVGMFDSLMTKAVCDFWFVEAASYDDRHWRGNNRLKELLNFFVEATLMGILYAQIARPLTMKGLVYM